MRSAFGACCFDWRHVRDRLRRRELSRAFEGRPGDSLLICEKLCGSGAKRCADHRQAPSAPWPHRIGRSRSARGRP